MPDDLVKSAFQKIEKNFSKKRDTLVFFIFILIVRTMRSPKDRNITACLNRKTKNEFFDVFLDLII